MGGLAVGSGQTVGFSLLARPATPAAAEPIEDKRRDEHHREETMTTTMTADAETLYRTVTRLQRVGLIVDRRALSPAHRRAAFVLQCLTASCPQEEASEPKRALIGFAYPNAR
jgi:hypothetical protein